MKLDKDLEQFYKERFSDFPLKWDELDETKKEKLMNLSEFQVWKFHKEFNELKYKIHKAFMKYEIGNFFKKRI